MRIIYVTSTLPCGSQEAFAIPEVKELQREGHSVLIVPVCPRGAVLHDDVKPLVKHAVARPLLSLDVLLAAFITIVLNPIATIRTLRWLFRSRSLGILLKNLAAHPKALWLARVARHWKADHIHAYWASTAATMALIAGAIADIPWSFTAHRWDIPENNLLALKRQRASFVRAIDVQGARELEAHVGPEARPPVVIHLGVDIDQVIRKTRPRAEGAVRIVTAANLVEKKGHTYLLEAVGILQSRGIAAHVDIAGDGPLRDKLQRAADEFGLNGHVAFVGAVSHEKLLRQMKEGAWDLVVLPSIVTEGGEKEGIPVSLIEAMSYQLPVVSTTTGGIPELLEGEAGVMVSPQDPIALADAIEELAKDPAMRERLGRAGRQRIEEEFAIDSVVARLVSHFEVG